MVIFRDDSIDIRLVYSHGITSAYIASFEGVKTALHYLEVHPEVRSGFKVKRSIFPIKPAHEEDIVEFRPELVEVPTSQSKGIIVTTNRIYENYRFILLDPDKKHSVQDVVDNYLIFLQQIQEKIGVVTGKKIQVKDFDKDSIYKFRKSVQSKIHSTMNGCIFYDSTEKGIICFYDPNPSKLVRSLLGLIQHNDEKNMNHRMMKLSNLEKRLVF